MLTTIEVTKEQAALISQCQEHGCMDALMEHVGYLMAFERLKRSHAQLVDSIGELAKELRS